MDVAAVIEKPKNFFDRQLIAIAHAFFLYSVWVNNIYINVKDIIPKERAGTS